MLTSNKGTPAWEMRRGAKCWKKNQSFEHTHKPLAVCALEQGTKDQTVVLIHFISPTFYLLTFYF